MLMAVAAVPDAHADMTQSDMWERVCNLERANRLIFKDFNKKVSDQHNDCLRRIGDVENHYEVYCEGLSMKMEEQSRSVTAKMSKMSKALEDAQASIDNINTVLLKVAPDVVEQVIFDRLRADGEASPSRLCIPRVPVCRFAAVAGGLHSCTDYCLRLTNPAKYYTCPCGIRQTGTPCSCGDGVGSASAKKGSGSGSASAKKGSGSAKKTKDTRLRKKECRFGFGIENKIQKQTRTNGIPAHNKARLTSSKTMTKFEPPRDHPRAVPGMRVVGRGWGANSDTQLIVAPKEDLPAEIEISSTPQFMKSLDEYCNVMNAQSGPESDFAKMKALRKQRGYMDKQGYTDAVENYLDYGHTPC